MNKQLKLGLKTICAAFAIAATAPSAAFSQTDKVIAFLMPDQASTRYEARDNPGFQQGVQQLCADCRVIYQNANGDKAKQAQQFALAIGLGADVIVVSAVDSTAGAEFVRLAKDLDVRVIAYDRPIPGEPADFYVSFDNEGIGRAITESLVDHLESQGFSTARGGVVQINGSPTDGAASLIKNGAYSILANSGFETLAEFDTPGWAPPKAQEWMASQLQKYDGQILGVVAANDGTAGGSIAAMKAAGISPLPPVTGNDATLEALQRILVGDQYNTISKPSEVVASAAAEVAVSFLQGQTPRANMNFYDTPSQLFVPAVVTRKNLKAEIIDKGIMSSRELCGQRFVRECRNLGIK